MTDTNYVAVPRELSDSVLERVGPINDYDGTQADADHRDWWATVLAEVAAPPAASGRAKDVTNLEIATAFHEAYERLAPRYGYETRPESRKPFSDLPNELKLLMVAVVREVRTLLAPAVDERAASSEPEMCPNCVTPWKCNGPHEFPQAASSEAAVAFDAERFERAPCYLCGYNGRGYYQPETHPCAAKYHAHPAPTTADAGVTEAMVETFEAKFLECARTRPDSTLRDDIRAALVAALGARKGK